MNNEAPFWVELSSLSDLFKDKETYSIPLYQRPYVWREEQNNRLWEDVMLCYQDKANHFLGSIVLMGYQKDEFGKWHSDVLVESGDYTVWHVVDGQQRLTSMSLMLAALYWDMNSWSKQASGFEGFDEVEEELDELKVHVRAFLRTRKKDTLSIQPDKKGLYIPRLVPVRSIFLNYERIINKNEYGRKIRLDKMYCVHQSNISDFRNKQLGEISDSKESVIAHYEFYKNLCSTLTNDIKFVKITCGAGQDPFQVFESLNGTGINLTESDRIKNLLMGVGHSQGVKQAAINTIWSDIAASTDASGSEKGIEGFLSTYMFIKSEKRVARGSLYKVFRDNYLKGEFDNDISQALHDLKRAAQYYGLIAIQKSFHDEDKLADVALGWKTESVLKAIMRNNRKQAVVPLLAAAQQYGVEESFGNIAKKLLSLLVRHKVCQLGTNELDRVFGKFCEIVKNSSAEKAIAFLDSHRQPDNKFARSFEDLTFDDKDVSRAAYYLHEIEDYLRTRKGNDVLSEDDYTVEHIIPQTPNFTEWFATEPEKADCLEDEDSDDRVEFFESVVKSIGNMCLLRRRENSGASNHDYGSKLEVYRTLEGEKGQKADATFALVKQLEDNSVGFEDDCVPIVQDGKTFDENSVRTRARFLAKCATAIW